MKDINKVRGKGEEQYANVFQFKKSIGKDKQEELRDFLYKFSINYTDARKKLSILDYMSEKADGTISSFFIEVHGMTLVCFAIAMRKMTDNSGKRSVKKLVSKVMKNQKMTDEAESKIEEIYSHYKAFLDKYGVHQDEDGIIGTVSCFPDKDKIEDDLEYLRGLYESITKKNCINYIQLDMKEFDFKKDIDRLLEINK